MPMTTPDPHDFLAVDALLSDEERTIRDTVRRWVQQRVMPDVADWYVEGRLPAELFTELGGLGLLGMHLDGYGCAGTSAVQYGLAMLELDAGDSGLRSLVSVQGSLAMFPIHSYGSDEQKEQWLPGMARGELVGCFGLTEPDAGSDPAGMRTTARRDGGDWILDGEKLWITNGNLADVAVVWARDGDGRVRGFLVPTDTPGFEAHPVPAKLSLRAGDTAGLSLTDVRLPDDAVLPEVASMRGPLSCLNEARFGILFGTAGVARACYEAALAYTTQREQFGGPVAARQLVQRRLVEMMIATNRAMLLALHIGRMKDAGTVTPHHVSLGKMDNARTALEVARSARALHGANGITADYHVMRHAANMETVVTYEGTEEIHTLILGQAITGFDAFR